MGSFQKELTEAFFIDENKEDGKKELSYTLTKFISFLNKVADNNGYKKMICLEFLLTPKVFIESDYELY